MIIIPLHTPTLDIPDLDRPIFGTRDHPFRVAVEAEAGDVVGMALEGLDWSRIVAFTAVELYREMAGGGDEGFVG